MLTHFHLDHVVGLGYMPGLRGAGGCPPRIWGPGAAVFGGSTDDVLRRAFTPPFADADYGLVAREVRELAVGEQQVAALRAYARERGWDLTDAQLYRDDGWSGARLDRPGLDQLRDAVARAAVDVLLVVSPDRLARRYAYQVWLLEEFARSEHDRNYGSDGGLFGKLRSAFR